MSNTENKGYQLADGSWSSEYKIGDKFVVPDWAATFSKGSVVSFYKDDGSSCPLFKLVSGEAYSSSACDGEAGAYTHWYSLAAYQEEPTQENGVENNDSGKATIYYTDGTTYTQTNVGYCINMEDTGEFVFVLTNPVVTKLLADVYMESESIKLNTQHIAGIVFKRGSYEEIYKLKPTFKSTFNAYNRKHHEGFHSPKYREENDSQKSEQCKSMSHSPYCPKIGVYVNQDELSESQVMRFFADCLQEGMAVGEGTGYLNNISLPYCGWAKEETGFYYSNYIESCEFSHDVTHIYKGL